MEHKSSDKAEYNYNKLGERIIGINHPEYAKASEIREMIKSIVKSNQPTLIMATGGSKTVAYYLEMILESKGIICEVIEPRDYTHKKNIERFSNIIVISASGKTNGIENPLRTFNGKKYLITEKEDSRDCNVISWGTKEYDPERSFISLSTSLGPITLFLDSIDTIEKEVSKEKIKRVNNKIKEMLRKNQARIDGLKIDYKDIPLIQVISGCENKASAATLESNLVETGAIPIIVHDKSSFCHGRSNLIYRNPNSSIIYLQGEERELDDLLIKILSKEYPHFHVFEEDDEDQYWREYSLLLQMYYLSKKVCDEKGIDITQPDYNPKVIKKVYSYRGEM